MPTVENLEGRVGTLCVQVADQIEVDAVAVVLFVFEQLRQERPDRVRGAGQWLQDEHGNRIGNVAVGRQQDLRKRRACFRQQLEQTRKPKATELLKALHSPDRRQYSGQQKTIRTAC